MMVVLDAVCAAGGFAAGFAASAFFLWSLFRQVRATAAAGRAPAALPIHYLVRIAVSGGIIGALVLLGWLPAVAGVAGFVAGRSALSGKFAKRLENRYPETR